MKINIENKITSKKIDQSWQVWVIFINVMFMKLDIFNNFIVNIKFINIVGNVINNLLISFPYVHGGGQFISLPITFSFWINWKYFPV
jgi:hypothetical protein